MTDDEKKEIAAITRDLYEVIIRAANRFLHNCKYYHIGFLRLENPSYAEIVDQLDEIRSIIEILCESIDDPMTHTNAEDYLRTMRQMAEAINAGDSDALNALVEELSRRSLL
ncbi:hypothetical protein [Pseudidiomarina gelatinasegens]|uniref:hypothetical protein n=1 Tax=Pseudidiomarina gelatinasegens TaxID=2487740 RepID=UPI0030EF48FC|tara:strand:+ start:3803 stop:4138 length:336 start_codon:yes stop_codon:yes gene_type:complete